MQNQNTALMTPSGLVDGLIEELRPVLSRVLLAGMGEDYEPGITLYDQTLPPPQTEEEEDAVFPYCLIELGDGRDTKDGSSQDVIILFGILDEDKTCKGYRDVANLVWATRFHLLTNQTIAGRFRLIKPLEWALPDGVASHPYYYGAIIAKYSIPCPAPTNPNT